MKNQVFARTIGLMGVLALAAHGTARAELSLNWSAYNDHYAGPATAAYVTAWNMYNYLNDAPGKSGALRDALTGDALSVSLTINYNGTSTDGTSSGSPNPGTPAYDVFHGFIDWGNVNIFNTTISSGPHIDAAATVDYVFTGLDASKSYSFLGTSVRGGSGGTYGQRWTKAELMGAQSAMPAHSTGSGIYTNNFPATEVALNSGQNAATGDYVSWTNIVPAADGSFTVRCTQYTGDIPGGTASGEYGYALMALRLQEYDSTQTEPSISEQPADAAVTEGEAATFHVKVSGRPSPALQWYRNGAALAGETNISLLLYSVSPALNGSQFQLVASSVYSNATHSVTSRVAQLSVAFDTVAPTLVTTAPAAGYRVDQLTSIEVFFSKPVTGVNAADLLINGAPATTLTEEAPEQYRFEFAQPAMGTINVAWSDSHGITDLTVSSNRFVGSAWTYLFDTNADYESIRINEFLAANQHVNRDEDGDYSDWIELYNSGLLTVPLAGCYLTDDPANLAKWRLPEVTLTSGSYLLVWASGKDRTNAAANLHANFQLAKDGGYLAWVKPDGRTILQEFTPAYPAQYADVSYGCDRTDPAVRGYFATPTPKAPNATSGSGFAPDVCFSRNSGTFTAPFALSLSTPVSNAVIRYTVGTNAPTASSPIYTGPIQVSGTVQIRARAYVDGLLAGDIQSVNFVLLDTSTSDLTSLNSTVPIMVIHNYGGGTIPVGDSKGGYSQFALIQVFEPKHGRSSLTNIPDVAMHGTIHRRGQTSMYNAKTGLRVETTDEYGGGKDVSLAGLPAENDWVLYGIDAYDKVLIHNPMAHGLCRELGRYSSRTRFVEVYLKRASGTPGPLTASDYYGLYVLEEKIKIGSNRVAIDKLEPENTVEPAVTGGYLFSIDKDGTYWMYAANSWLYLLDPQVYWGSAQYNYLSGYLDSFYSALTRSDWTNAATGYAHYIDVPAWIDYHLNQVVVYNADMLRISSYYCKPRGGKVRPAALWDFDRSFGTCASGDYRGFNPFRWRSGNGDQGTDPFNAASTVSFDNPWYGKLFTDPDFWQGWIDRYQELRHTVYSSTNIAALIDGFAAELKEVTPREYKRWKGGGDSDTSPNSGTVSADGWSYTFPTPGTWEGQVTFAKTWFTNRFLFMDTNFLDRPALSQAGGVVPSGSTLTLSPAAEAGSYVVYTLDGRDPRLPGGAVASYAWSNSGPVTLSITGATRVVARSWNASHRNLTGKNNPPISSSWSGVTRSDYYTAVPALRIAELMYHPASLAGDGTNANESFEYLELANPGSETLNLAGFQISGGVDFQFASNSAVTALAPGARVLVVKSLAAFSLRYPALVSLVAGEYTGQLNNAGDHLVLTGPAGESIQDFTFSPAWYPLTDGRGFSLVAVDLAAAPAAWSLASQWRASAFDGGSPGEADRSPAALLPVRVNEVLSSPVVPQCDTIELWNPNPESVDISYWYLTDTQGEPRKFLIPPGTTIPARGYRVFYQTNSFGLSKVVNALGLTNQAFALDSDGEAAYLYSGDDQGRLTGYRDGFDFGAAAPGVTFGRYVNSAGKTSNPALSAVTWGAPNAYPLVGPVVISELLYAPASLLADQVLTDGSRDEYVELHNLTAQVVPLYDRQFPANTWHARGGIDYDFPSGAQLPPHGYLILVSFNPTTDPDAAADFLARHGNAANATLYGPYRGRLNNAGDEVTLRRPGAVKTSAQSPAMILVDRVNYGVAAPWPDAANGTGASIQRLDFAAYGDDPANWTSGAPTPGRQDANGEPPVLTAQPQPRTVAVGAAISLSALAGGEAVGYQWYLDGLPMDGANESTLSVASAQLSHAGGYRLAALNDNGATLSQTAPVVVVDLPGGQTVEAGATATLAVVVATPSADFTQGYQWLFNGSVIASGVNTAGSDGNRFTNDLVLTRVSAAQSGDYVYAITNSTAAAARFTTHLTVTGGTNVEPVRLAVELQAGQIVLSWPQSTGSWQLEEATAVSGNWQASSATPAWVNDRWQVTLPAGPATTRFFRLKAQP